MPSVTPAGFEMALLLESSKPMYEAAGPRSPHLTVYADESRGGPGTGPAIAAAFAPGTDAGPSITQPTLESSRDVTVRGNRGWTGVTEGGEIVVAWNGDNGSQEPDVYAVYGRDVDEADVMRAAEAAEVDADFHVSIPDDVLPASLAVMAEGAAFPHLIRNLAAGFTIEYSPPTPYAGRLIVSTYTADPSLVRLVDYVAGGDATTVRGHPGVRGTVDDGNSTAVAWVEDGLVAVAQADDGVATPEAFDAFVASLEIRPAAEVLSARRQVAEVEPEHLLEAQEVLAASGPVGDDGVWAVGISGTPGHLTLHSTGRQANGEQVGGSFGSVGPGPALDTSFGYSDDGGALDLVMVYDPRIATVQLDLADGTEVPLVGGGRVMDSGVDLGIRVYGVWLEPASELAALDAFGADGALILHREVQG